MQDQLKHLNEEILPEAYQMLENGNSISEVRIQFSNQIEPKLEKNFVNSLNFYVKNSFKEKYNLVKNILVGLFTVEVVLLTYETVSEVLNGTRTLSTLAWVLNVFWFALFLNLIYRLAKWDGRYIRSILIFMVIFTMGDLLLLFGKLSDLFFLFKLVLQFVIAILGLFLYRKIFPSHGFFGPPKEVIKEKDILDDFR